LAPALLLAAIAEETLEEEEAAEAVLAIDALLTAGLTLLLAATLGHSFHPAMERLYREHTVDVLPICT